MFLGWTGANLQPPSTTAAPSRPVQHQQDSTRLRSQQPIFLNRLLNQHESSQNNQSLHTQKLQQQQAQSQQQRSHIDNSFNSPVSGVISVISADSPNVWDNQSSDPVLSDLLDQVIDIVPEGVSG